jgi:hypothetical protein
MLLENVLNIGSSMVPLYILRNFFFFLNMVHISIYEFFGKLPWVSTPLLIRRKSINSLYRAFLQVLMYKYHKDLGASNKPKFNWPKRP